MKPSLCRLSLNHELDFCEVSNNCYSLMTYLFSSMEADIHLTGITELMENFKALSGLRMNTHKSLSCSMGGALIHASILSNLFGTELGSFPTRYLGLPLNLKCISMATLQLLFDRIIAKIHCWTVKFLSFVGKIRLVASTVFGIVSF